jgi:Arc/MetJ family transcription regulator
MTRLSIDVDDEALAAAQQELGTSTKVATVNAALQLAADRAKVREAIAVLDTVELNLEGSDRSFRFSGGRDLSQLAEKARREVAEADAA